MSYGIDYGMGESNIDHATGIRFGVIRQDEILLAWADSAEADYGAPTCGECGNEASPIDAPEVPDLDDCPSDWRDEGRDYACLACKRSFDQQDAFGDEPRAYTLDDGEYVASQSGDDCDVFVIKSPFYTHAQFCSPCAPGACHLSNPVDSDGPRAYCFAPDWFDYFAESGVEPAGEYDGQKTSCPYPVYRVADGQCVYRPYGMDQKPQKPR